MQEFATFFEVLVKRDEQGPQPVAYQPQVGMAVAQPMQAQVAMAVAQPIGQMQPQMVQPQTMQASGVGELAAFGDLFIKQRVEMLEALSGFETANEYDILGTTGMGMQPVFFAGEKSGCCARNCCGPRARSR